MSAGFSHEPQPPNRPQGGGKGPWSNQVAAYVRMSTEQQQHSTSKQMDVIREYAKLKGLIIVREYLDGRAGGGDT